MSDWTPTNERQHPPFEPGNTMTPLRHGAYSPRRVDPLAEQLVEALLADEELGYLAAPSYRPAVWAWARAEARVQLIDEWLGCGIGDLEEPAVLAAHTLLDRAFRAAERARATLGLDPMSRARLGRDVAATKVDLVAVLTAAREQADRAAVAGPASTAVVGSAASGEGEGPGVDR